MFKTFFRFTLLLMGAVGSYAFADLSFIEGEWTTSSNLIAITRAQHFGWNLWQDNKGRGSIVESADGGGNIQVKFGGIVCDYYVSTTNHEQRMVWTLKYMNPPESTWTCIQEGVFDRVDPAKPSIEPNLEKIMLRPQKPVEDGTWKYDLKCSNGDHYEGSGLFQGGRRAESFGNGFSGDLIMQYDSSGKIKASGVAGVDRLDLFDFILTKDSSGKYLGSGKWGDRECTFSTEYVDDAQLYDILRAWGFHSTAQVISILVKCSGKTEYRFDYILLRHGIGGFGFESTGGEHVTALVQLQFSDKKFASGKFAAHFYAPTKTYNMDFNINLTSRSDEETSFIGAGVADGKQNCSISITSRNP